ncbi:MAG: RP853 family protein [Rickettsia endosymbiont of Bryobia graminum]|nr:RP853 family protein [Rickettsia endosymbiont of Bryobia graminum]
MDNKLIDVFNIADLTLAEKIISATLVNNITSHACLTLARIIAIDHKARLKSIPEIRTHLNNCIYKLKSFLGQKVLTDDSFSTILTLFAVAISPETTDFQDNNILQKSENILIDTLINIHFPDVNIKEKNNIKLILKNLFSAKNSYEIINLIQAEPEIFQTTIMSALKKYQNLIEINQQIKSDLDKIANITSTHYKKIEILRQAASKIITAICTVAVGAITVATTGASSALMVVPAAILAVKYAPKIGESIGARILSIDKSLINEQEKINWLKTNINKNNKEFLYKEQLLAKFEIEKINQLNTGIQVPSIKVDNKNSIPYENAPNKKLQQKDKSIEKRR